MNTTPCRVPGCRADLSDAAAYAEHLESHFMPEAQEGAEPGTRQLATINVLTDADGLPAWGLGPDVAVLVLVTSEGMGQIIGRPDLDGHAAAHALMECAQTIHVQQTGKRVFTLPCDPLPVVGDTSPLV